MLCLQVLDSPLFLQKNQALNIALKQDAKHRSASCGSTVLLVLSGRGLLSAQRLIK